MIDINELRRLAQDATPGPWYAGNGNYEGRNIYSVVSVTDSEGFTYQPVIATAEDNDTPLWPENTSFITAVNPAVINELLDRLEAAEDEVLEQARLNGIGAERELALMARVELAEKERDALRAKIEAMEKQEPVAFVDYKLGNCFRWAEYLGWQKIKDGTRLYTLPGAKGE